MNFVFEVKINISIEDNLKKSVDKISNNIKNDAELSLKSLASTAFEKAQKIADERLSPSISNVYKKNLNIEQISENVTVITLDQEAEWIENGRKSGFMKELLDKGAKTAKDGSRYRVIPLKSKKNTNNPVNTENLLSELKSFLGQKSIRNSSDEKLELDNKGSPRVGKLHSFNIKNIRDKKAFSDNIDRVNVSQDKNPKTGKVERNITVFRVISEKHKSQGKWVHPGTKPEKILEETYRWIEQAWQTDILPRLKEKYGA